MADFATAPPWTFRNHWMSQVGRHAQMQPSGTALRHLGADTTWASLDERSRRLAGGLRDLGVGEGDRVALLCLNHPQFVEIVLAANHLGAIAVPLNFRLTPPELAYILGDCGAGIVFVDTPLAPVLAATPGADQATRVVIGAPVEGHLAYDDLLAEPIEPGDVSEEATALLMYTSGTTGKPKGAMLSHRNLHVQSVTCIRAMETFDESDIGFMTAPFSTSPVWARWRRTCCWGSQRSSIRSVPSTRRRCWTPTNVKAPQWFSTCHSNGSCCVRSSWPGRVT